MAISHGSNALEATKWVFITLLLVAAVWANYYYSEIEWSIRLIGWLLIGGIILLIAYQTKTGRQAWGFVKGSRIELRKVVWPSRQETVRTTFMIVVMVAIMALILWAIDSLLLWMMAFFTGSS